MKAYIVTGTTSGIGEAIAREVVKAKQQLFTLSRAPDQADGLWRNVACDFRRHADISIKLKHLIGALDPASYGEMVLINNAGVLDPMGPLQASTGDQIVNHLLVNQAAPAILMSAFIRLTANRVPRRRIINISSGAARHPYSGWAMYCASKAALDMMTLCLAAEQKESTDPISVSSVYPGKVETRMQRQIRQCGKDKFPRQPEFVAAKEHGELLRAEDVARLLLALDLSGELKNGGIYDLRHTKRRNDHYTISPLNRLD